jgi:hypothetical protein
MARSKSPAKRAVSDFLKDLGWETARTRELREALEEFAERIYAEAEADSICPICGGADDHSRDEIDDLDRLDKKRFAEIDRMKPRQASQAR